MMTGITAKKRNPFRLGKKIRGLVTSIDALARQGVETDKLAYAGDMRGSVRLAELLS